MILFSYAFRFFFLAAGAYAIVAMLAWTLAWHGSAWPAGPMSPDPAWHAHEMTLGFAGAVVAGFLLTAVATWTGRPPVRGRMLAALALAWLLGRTVALFPGSLGPVPIAILDLVFPAMLALLATREIVRGGSRRNFGIAGVTWLLVAFTVLYHLGRLGILAAGEWLAASLAVHLLALLVVVIGGRVVPQFTANWLRLRGDTRPPPAWGPLDTAGVALVGIAGLAESLWTGTIASSLACLAAGTVTLARLAHWRGLATAPNPLLWVMHAAYAAVGVGYLVLAAAGLGLPLPRSAAVHLLTIGGIAGMILAMMTRVSLGHTGRPLAVGRVVVAAYLLLGAAAVVRSVGMLLPIDPAFVIDLSAGLWGAAFVLFLWRYAPILAGPRIDATAQLPPR